MTFDTQPASKAVIIAAGAAGTQRTQQLQQWLDTQKQRGARTWLLNTDRDVSGHWAGLNTLVESLLTEIQAEAPELITQYDYELALILPTLQRTVKVRNPNLTDISNDAERTRNYPADRAFRVVQGVVDLVHMWQTRQGYSRWCIACDTFDNAGVLVKLFFKELIRRSTADFPLTLVLAVDPHQVDAVQADFAHEPNCRVEQLDVAADEPVAADPDKARAQLKALLEQIDSDVIENELHLPQLIRLATQAQDDSERLWYMQQALSLCSTRGLYEDALYYGEPLRTITEERFPHSTDFRLNTYIKLYNCYIGLNRPLEALEIAETAISITDKPEFLFHWYYLTAMIYARFLVPRDFDTAEKYLDLGLEAINRADMPRHEQVFQTVFNRNGLALIRHFQKRPLDAIELCQSGFELLDAELDPQEQRLHRSVLLYNIAQVYDSIREHEKAIEYYSEAMQMDPNYSEYYNERGNIYLKLERYAEAEQDYLKAIEVSPPYTEVWTNLGQCLLLQERFAEAIQAYARAIDLSPDNMLAFTGRAQSYEALGDVDAALADYNVLLEHDSAQPELLANRAVLHYEQGNMQAALQDLDAAIGLAPDLPDLYENRAIAWEALGALDKAEHDRQQVLRLTTDTTEQAQAVAHA